MFSIGESYGLRWVEEKKSKKALLIRLCIAGGQTIHANVGRTKKQQHKGNVGMGRENNMAWKSAEGFQNTMSASEEDSVSPFQRGHRPFGNEF